MKACLSILVMMAAMMVWGETGGTNENLNTTYDKSESPFSDRNYQALEADKIRLSSTGLVMKVFQVSPAHESLPNTIEYDGPLKEIFSRIAGVEWPSGSFVWLWGQGGLLIFRNTPANMARIEKVISELNLRPKQVEIECQFVAFDASEVEKLAIKQAINAGSLTELWAAGKGELIAAPRVVTRSGSEAVFRGVQEMIYPTEFTVSEPEETTSNDVVSVTTTVPYNFETRELGSVLSVIPEVSAEGGIINLNMRPEWVELAGWEGFGMEVPDGTNGVRTLSMRQPVFYRSAVETQISIASGKRILMGGGVPGKEKGTLIYTFVSCRLVDIEGKPVPSLAETIMGTNAAGK